MAVSEQNRSCLFLTEIDAYARKTLLATAKYCFLLRILQNQGRGLLASEGGGGGGGGLLFTPIEPVALVFPGGAVAIVACFCSSLCFIRSNCALMRLMASLSDALRSEIKSIIWMQMLARFSTFGYDNSFPHPSAELLLLLGLAVVVVVGSTFEN